MWAALLLAIAPAPGAQDVPTLSVRELLSSPYEYDGRRVRVEGWLGKCTREKCSLQAKADDDYFRVSLGKSGAFDRRAARLRSRWVTVEGTVHARCFGGHVIDDAEGNTLAIASCPIRPEQLANPRIVDNRPGPVEP